MFEPKLGVSLVMISRTLTPEALSALGGSRIATLEITPLLLGEDETATLTPVLKTALQKTGIRAASVHALFGVGYDISVPEPRARRHALCQMWRAIDLAEDLGAGIVVVHSSAEPIEARYRAKRLVQARAALEEVCAYAQQKTRRIAVELLPRSCLGNTLEELLQLLPAQAGVCLDTNHLMSRYADLPQLVRRLGERLYTTHLSDYDGVDEKHELPGRGVIDWKAFMQALADIDYQGPFNYEVRLEGTPLERVRSFERNFEWITRLN